MICKACNQSNPADSLFCQYCGAKMELLDPAPANEPPTTYVEPAPAHAQPVPTTPTPTVPAMPRMAKWKQTPFFTAIAVVCISFTALALLCIILAMLFQDPRRDQHEAFSPTLLYIIMEAVGITYLVTLLYAEFNDKRGLQGVLGLIPLVLLIFVLIITEGFDVSIFADTRGAHSDYRSYQNASEVRTLNLVWVILSVFTVIASHIVWIGLFIRRCVGAWHKSVAYRETCYKKVAKMRGYLERGIITQQEFEETRSKIMQKIQ